MYRLQYTVPYIGMQGCEWFLSNADAMNVVDRLDIETYRIRFIEFPFKVTRNSSGLSEDGYKLQWLNEWADTARG